MLLESRVRIVHSGDFEGPLTNGAFYGFDDLITGVGTIVIFVLEMLETENFVTAVANERQEILLFAIGNRTVGAHMRKFRHGQLRIRCLQDYFVDRRILMILNVRT